MSLRTAAARLVVASIALACAPPLAAQTPTLRQPTTQPVPTAPLKTQTQVQLLPPNITRWGMAEGVGGQSYGKTGQRIFIEGRDLDPNRLVLELRDGARAVPFTRRAGGSSARVEFTIPPQAVTGELTYTLQAVQGGARVLSPSFGVCDQVSISAVTPNEIQVDHRRSRDVNGEIPLQGTRLSLVGGCLGEVVFADSKNRKAVRVGAGALVIAREVSRSFGRIELELGSYVPPSGAGDESRGPIGLATPRTGPSLAVVGFSQPTTPPATPPPPPLSVIRIDRVESQQTWGAPPAAKVPFVVTQTDTEGMGTIHGAKRWNNFVHVHGENLAANTGTLWRIGDVEIGRANEASPPMVTFAMPANAVTAPVCAVRRDGARFCSKLSLPVVAGPRIVQVPSGWARNGTPDQSQHVTARVRQAQVITGFDMVPRGVANLSAELVVTNYDAAAARACNLDFRVLRLEANRIEFSFGAPGSTRPAGCTVEQERMVNFMRPGSGPTSPGGATVLPGRVHLSLNWVYQGQLERVATWNVHGTL